MPQHTGANETTSVTCTPLHSTRLPPSTIPGGENHQGKHTFIRAFAVSITLCLAEACAAGEETAQEESSDWNLWRQMRQFPHIKNTREKNWCPTKHYITYLMLGSLVYSALDWRASSWSLFLSNMRCRFASDPSKGWGVVILGKQKC